MNATQLVTGDWESEAYAVTARREAASTRPPRRESPRFSNQQRKSSGVGGAHQRRNKRWGM